MSALQPAILPAASVLWLLNVALLATVASGAGLAVLVLCRRSSARVRRASLLAPLFLTLTAPALVALASQTGLQVVHIDTRSRTREAGVHTKPPVWTPTDRSVDHPWEPNDGLVPSHVASSENVVTAAASPSWLLLGSVLSYAWALGAAVCLGRLIHGWTRVLRLRASCRPLHEGAASRAITEISKRFSLKRIPDVVTSRLTPVPLAMGWLRPVIVFPRDLLRKIDRSQLEDVLVHEVAHIAHHDPWLGIAQRTVRALFWWNPVVLCALRALSRAQEELCDDHVVAAQGDGSRFARLLTDLADRVARARWVTSVGMFGMSWAGEDSLTTRVKRLLDGRRPRQTSLSRRQAFALSMFLLATSGLLLACPIDFVETAKALGDREQKTGPEVLRILYLEGSSRWEYRYLKNVLLRDPTIEAQCLLVSEDSVPYQEASPGLPKLETVPTDRQTMFQYDVLILGDLPAPLLEAKFTTTVAEFVKERGGGLVVIAGERFSDLSRHLQDVLPVTGGQKGSPKRGEESRPEPFHFRLTEAGAEHAMLQLSDRSAESRRLLEQDLPPVFHCHEVGAPRAGAQVLAVHPTEATSDGTAKPLLVLGAIGHGTTIVSAVDDLWRWRASGGTRYRRFWSQVVRGAASNSAQGD